MDTCSALIERYNDIVALTQEASDLYQKIENAKRGISTENSKIDHSLELFKIRDAIKKNSSQKSKKKRNLAPSAKEKKPENVMKWTLELEQLELEYEYLQRRKKELEEATA
ncbi:MAG: hypothetical protein AAF363_18710 [Bacteroidota bacterium]